MQSQPNWTLTYETDPGLQGLVWDLRGEFFPINATTFFSPVVRGKKAKSAFLFHHGHSNCVCPSGKDDAPIVAAKCRPGCNSSMPTLAEIGDPGYSWWDLYNVSGFIHSLGHDVFILSMPLKGVNLGPGCNDTYLASDHEWFRQWEEQGDSPLRYFLEPTYLTVNYAKAAGYDKIYMAGLSGGGWSTTFAAAIDKRIDASFPIAGSLPCDMRNPESWDHPQSWTGDSDEDYEQSCRPNSTDPNPDPTGPDCRPTPERPHPPCPDARPVRICCLSSEGTLSADASAEQPHKPLPDTLLSTDRRGARRSVSATTRVNICWQGLRRDASKRRFYTSTTRAVFRHTIATTR